MDAAQVALIVAGITAGAGIVQGTVQGWIISRATRVAARQEAIKVDIALLERLGEQLAAMGQAANDYALAIADKGFYTDEKWAELRQPLLRELTATNGAVYYSAYAIGDDSGARKASLEAASIVMDLGLLATREQPVGSIIQSWSNDSPKIKEAIEVVGRERRGKHQGLETVTRNGASRAIRWLLHRRTIPPGA
jgi:F0F1-type ATP synthase membrane subunit c/vacuolar-type H+-ATPase subunit K